MKQTGMRRTASGQDMQQPYRIDNTRDVNKKDVNEMKQKTKLMLAAAAVSVLAAAATSGLVPAESAAGEADVRQAYTSGDYSYTVKADGTAEITGYSGSGTDITVPGELDGHDVTSIGSEAFMENEQLKSVRLPDSIADIGSRAFSGCISMKSVKTGSGLKSIGYRAFYDCLSLSDATIPDGVTGIGDSAFRGCKSLTVISVPGSVERIGSYAFSSCSRLEDLTLSYGIRQIGEHGFAYCSSLQRITIPDSVTVMEAGAFYRCRDLKTVRLPEGIERVEKEMFSRCWQLGDVKVPEGVTSIGENAFYECKSVKHVELPESLTTIETEAFWWCTGLRNIELPPNVRKLGKGVFRACHSLESVTVPEGIASISGNAFAEDRSLTSVELPDSLVRIGTAAFRGCSKLKSIDLPDGLVSIEANAFMGCDGMRKVTIPGSVAYIGSKAFHSYSNGIVIYCGCGSYAETYAVKNDIDFAGSDYSRKMTRARIGSSGKMTVKCRKCGKTVLKKTVPKIATVKLIQKNYRYTGNTIEPYMDIEDSKGRQLKKYTDFTIKHVSDGKRIGSQKVKIMFRGRYAGASERSFSIVSSMKKPDLKAKSSGRAVTLSWKDIAGAKGYKIYVKEPGSSRYICRITKKSSVRSVTHRGLKRGKTYRYKMRAYKTTGGTTEYSPYSEVRTVRVK